MDKNLNLFFCLLSFLGLIAACYFLIDGSQPCSGVGCMVRQEIKLALILFIIFGPLFYITLKKEMKRLSENKSRTKDIEN